MRWLRWGGAGWAAVYRGPRSVPGCPEAAADLVRAAGLAPRYVGPGERVGLAAALARSPRLYVQPGGGELDEAWAEVQHDEGAIRRYVRAGGAYLGVCLGGYLAGSTPGYGLLPGDTDSYVRRPGGDLSTTGDSVVEVCWLGRPRRLYAQDPPVFLLDERAAGTELLARYRNGDVAAALVGYGRGAVAVTGPHPEATDDWFTDAGLTPVRPSGSDLGVDLVGRLLQAAGST